MIIVIIIIIILLYNVAGYKKLLLFFHLKNCLVSKYPFENILLYISVTTNPNKANVT